MTVPTFSDKAYERDMYLARGLSGATDHIRQTLREWIQAELIALLATADAHAPLGQGLIADRIEKLAVRLRQINHSDFPEADANCSHAIDQVQNGGYDDAIDAYERLRQGHDDLLQLVRELRQARELIGTAAED